MSAQETIDGTGTGTKMKVDSTHRAWGRNVSDSSIREAAINGDDFAIFVEVTFTNATTAAHIFYKNKESVPVLLHNSIYNVGVSTGGTDDFIKIITTAAPTAMAGGTGTEAIAFNTNGGSPKTLDMSDSEVGQTGATITGSGEFDFEFLPTGGVTTKIPSGFITPPGAVIAVSIKPPTLNTSITISAFLNLYRIQDATLGADQ